MKKRPNAGFTIIEVLIVLAIAGLILMLIFLALPTLQRNSRNNQRRQDVTAVLEAISHFELNNSGTFPDCGYVSFPSCQGAIGSGALLQYYNGKLTYYTNGSQVVVHAVAAGNNAPSNNPNTDLDTLYVFNHQKCSTTQPGRASSEGAGFNDVVALFAIESGAGVGSQCQEL